MEGKFFSWTIDGDIAVKEIDKSVVDHHGTGIPHEIREYWKATKMEPGDKKFVTLLLNDNTYFASLEMRKDRTRLFWHSDFRDAAYFRIYEDEQNRELLKPYILFRRLGNDQYSVEILSNGMEFEKSQSIPQNSSCYVEGGRKVYYTSKYERKAKCRQQAIDIHGCKCSVCGFDFKAVYGDLGEGYTEIHHKKPLHSLEEEVEVNPETDLVPVCSNCHRMLHRRRDRIMTIEELKNIIKTQRLPTINI